MSLTWHEDLATGIEGIDSQHKEIFSRFAAFTAACGEGAADTELLHLLDFLATYTGEHFRREEEALAEVEYPQLDAQKESHAAFMADFCRLKRMVEEVGPTLESILTEKRNMIRWLINHINHMDRAFAEFLAAMDRHLPIAPIS